MGGQPEAKGWVKQCRSGCVSPWVVGQSGDRHCFGAIPSPQGQVEPGLDMFLHSAAMGVGTRHPSDLDAASEMTPPRAARCCCEEWAGTAGSCCGPGQGSALSLAAAPLSQGTLWFNRTPLPKQITTNKPVWQSLSPHLFPPALPVSTQLSSHPNNHRARLGPVPSSPHCPPCRDPRTPWGMGPAGRAGWQQRAAGGSQPPAHVLSSLSSPL